MAAVLALSLTACGGGVFDDAASSAPMAREDGLYGGAAEGAVTSNAQMDLDAPQGEPFLESPADAVPAEAPEEKVIHTAHLELETTEFDQSAAALEKLTEELGGYFENSSSGDRGSGYRWADYTVRVPSERYEAFLNQAGELCHETWRSTNRENISEVYYDTAGRLKTQQIKLERLQALLAEADNMADLITIESAISETEWMIEDLTGTLRHYDAQVDYATINISLQEVYRLSNVEEPATGLGGRLSAAFADGMRAFGASLENLAVALAYGWIWILLAAAAVLAAVFVVRKRLRRRTKAEKKADDRPEKL